MIYLIIGYGSIGKVYLNILKKNKFNHIYVLDTIFKKKILKKNITFLDQPEFRKLLIKPNYVFICTPSFNHFNHAQYYLKKKIPVLIEKPFVLKTSDAKNLINLAKKNKVRCWVCFQNRLNKSVIAAKKLIKSNKIGKIKFINSSLFWSRDKIYYANGWRGRYSKDGGVLSNQAIHLLDILIYFFGTIDKFNGSLLYDKSKLSAEDLISLFFLNKSNIPISFNATTRAKLDYGVALDVYGTKGKFEIKGLCLNELYLNNKRVQSASEKFNKGYGLHHSDVINKFLFEKKDLFKFHIKNNLHAIKLINSIYNKLIGRNYYFRTNSNDSILGDNGNK